MGKNNCILVYVGDRVMVYFDHRPNPQPCEVEVLEVARRYGHINNGMTPVNPLLKGRFVDTGAEQYFDSGYVTSIVVRSNKPQPTVNIYAQDQAWYCVARTRRGSIWEGSLHDLTVLALSQLPFPIEREINPERLYKLYGKQRAGLISESRMYGTAVYVVKRDIFQRWVRKYYTSLIFTVKEADAMETAVNKKWESAYLEDMRKEIEQDLRRDEGEFPGEPYYDEPSLA